jgi:hypothetical protein
MSLENTLWGAPHIHGELRKLGFTVAQSTVAKYIAKKGDDAPSGHQSWSTPPIAAIDLFVVLKMARGNPIWTSQSIVPSADNLGSTTTTVPRLSSVTTLRKDTTRVCHLDGRVGRGRIAAVLKTGKDVA